jgi:peptide/nickel transport system substrate-binding protein
MRKLSMVLAILLVCAFIATSCSTTSSTTPAATTPAPTAAATTSATTSTTTSPATTAPAAPKPATTTIAATVAPATTAAANKYGGILKLAAASGPAVPFGAPWENAQSPLGVQQQSLDLLVNEQVDGSILPGLATSWVIVTDPANASLTFSLRKGVKFSDGTDFNAQAVKFNLDMWSASKMAIGTTQFWKSVDVIDDSTVKISLTAWKNYMLRSFSDGAGFVVSPTAYQKNGIDSIRYNMVTTGPFIQKSFSRDVSMMLDKNPNYWQTGKPYLDGIQTLYVVDDQTRTALFKSGGADMMDCNNNNLIASQLNAAGYQILVQPHSGFFSLVPDSINADSPWSNIKVRMAAEYAINKEALWSAFGYGYDVPAYQYYPQGSGAYDPNLVPRKYDLAKAKQLMVDAGYPNGFKSSIVVAVNASRDAATAIQAQLSVIGIQCDLQFPQNAAWIQQVTGTWHNGLQFMNQSLYSNPNANWNLFESEPTPNWLKSLKHPPGWKDLLDASFNTKDPDPAAMQKLEDALYNDVTMIPLSHHQGTFAASAKVNDTGYGTRGLWPFWNVQNTWLSKP